MDSRNSLLISSPPQLVDEDDDQPLRAMHADGQHALDVGGAAGAGDEGDVVGLLRPDLGQQDGMSGSSRLVSISAM